MRIKLSEKQRRDLLELVINEVEMVKGDVSPKDRNVLIEAGLIELVPRPGGRTQTIVATEAAWEWAVENFDQPFTNPSLKPRGIWNGLTHRLKRYLALRGENLATLCADTASSAPREMATETRADPRLRAAYLRLTGGQIKRRVRLAELRREAAGERVEIDEALRTLARCGDIALFPEDKQYALRPEDHDAALDESGVAMHIIYWEVK